MPDIISPPNKISKNNVNQLEIIRKENPLAHASIVQRQAEANRQTQIANEIRALYPGYGDAVVIKMKHGQVLRVGFELALATLLRDDAELVKPPAVRETAMLGQGETRGVTVLS